MFTLRVVLALVSIFLVSLEAPAGASAESRIQSQQSSVPLTLFYHPPRDATSVSIVAERFHSAILTRGDERYRDQLRAAGFSGPILQYLVANEASGPAGLRNASERCGDYLTSGNDVSGIARDFCESLHPYEDAFLHNGAGERLYTTLSWQEQSGTKKRYYYLMNPASQRWIEYFIGHASANASQMGYTGLFIDNLDRSLERGLSRAENSDSHVAEYDSDLRYRDAVKHGLSALRNRLATTPIWGNVTTSYYRPLDGHALTPLLDAVMNEYFVGLWRGGLPTPDHWELQLQQAERVVQENKAFIAVAQGGRGDLDRLRFALGSFLLVADQRAYFRYTDDATYEEAWLYDDYRASLGAPLTDRYQAANGTWRRDFQCGRVSVDPLRHRGSIETTGGCAPGQ
jgi:hypothetical protein